MAPNYIKFAFTQSYDVFFSGYANVFDWLVMKIQWKKNMSSHDTRLSKVINATKTLQQPK